MEKKVKKVKKVRRKEGVFPLAEVATDKGNPGFFWWVLLGAVVGFAVLLLLGAVALVVLLSLG